MPKKILRMTLRSADWQSSTMRIKRIHDQYNFKRYSTKSLNDNTLQKTEKWEEYTVKRGLRQERRITFLANRFYYLSDSLARFVSHCYCCCRSFKQYRFVISLRGEESPKSLYPPVPWFLLDVMRGEKKSKLISSPTPPPPPPPKSRIALLCPARSRRTGFCASKTTYLIKGSFTLRAHIASGSSPADHHCPINFFLPFFFFIFFPSSVDYTSPTTTYTRRCSYRV